ncbi:hypothetical protein DCS_05733 [Drechmeria coniospora]|uniref:CN hydrolase domain-containing protein n=1 Tax=Drechmeria coniospora TaxID=98403 RepID=A0A151GNP8_DRECN|nr:hypothetical protein DCS_05733 [Drechmeria coniospora]KYK58716.1 hypothetical protein DCS_05733 [Drechmeria coniospora]
MRIGCLQFAPRVGDVNNNLSDADAVLNRVEPEDLDLLVLPELAFSGYNFKSLREIEPFLEHSESGISSLWARTVALKYDCTVLVGYPEKVDPELKWPTGPEYYNSAIVMNKDGEAVANYRKSHLYMTDETWAFENPEGFYRGFLVGLGHTAIGICMDLNPYKFQAPWDTFEFAFHALEMDANLVILTMAWMTREDGSQFSLTPREPDMETLAYWLSRIEPIIRSDGDEEIIVVFANRCGTEAEAVYAGTSAVLGIKSGEVRVYGVLGRGEEELLVVDTNDPPDARLVYRPKDQEVTPDGDASTEKKPPIETMNRPLDDSGSNISESGNKTGSGGSTSSQASTGSSTKAPLKTATHSILS